MGFKWTVKNLGAGASEIARDVVVDKIKADMVNIIVLSIFEVPYIVFYV